MTNEEAKKLWFDSIEIVKCDMAKAEPDKLAAKVYLLGEEVSYGVRCDIGTEVKALCIRILNGEETEHPALAEFLKGLVIREIALHDPNNFIQYGGEEWTFKTVA